MNKALRKITKWTSILLIIGGIAAGGYYGVVAMGERSATSATTSIPRATVQQGPFSRTVSSTGALRASRSFSVSAPHRGQVTRIITEGTRVQEGDPLFWMDTQEDEDSLRDLEAELQLAIKDLDSAKEEYRLQEIQNDYNMQSELGRVELSEQRLEDARQKYESERILVERAISPQSRLDEAELSRMQAQVELRNAMINLRKTEENLVSNMRIRQTAIDRAQLAVERIEREIEDRKERIEASTVRSPATGEVSFLRVWRSGQASKLAEGDTVHPRVDVMEIPDRSEMQAVIPVSELDVSRVQPGQPARIMLEAVPGRVFEGVVERKSPVPIDASQSTRPGAAQTGSGGPREFEVVVRLNEPEDIFFQGMTASVTVDVEILENALQVPLEALTMEDGEVGVFRVTGSTAEFVRVEPKLINHLAVAFDGNIEAGEQVYLRHPQLDFDGSRERSFLALREVRRQIDGSTPLPGIDAETQEELLLSDAGTQ